MKININHINKMEGHAGFVASIMKGEVKQAKFVTQEGIRLFEAMVLQRDINLSHLVTSRICGICPVVHSLTNLKAIENALDIKITKQTYRLRKLLELAQIIHSHGLHLFFLTLADYFNLDNDINLIKKYPKETKAALDVRKFGTEIIRVFGGRTVHMTSVVVGGFRHLPSKDEIEYLRSLYDKALNGALILAKLFTKIKYPDFERKTEYMSLSDVGEYAIYGGALVSSEGLAIPVNKYKKNIKEIDLPYQSVKRTQLRNNRYYFVGALSRICNNFYLLQPEAQQIWHKARLPLPSYNIFHNIIAQAVELVHCIIESKKLLDFALSEGLKKQKIKYELKYGEGVGAMEAPRGVLFHAVKVNKKGKVIKCDIITPTAQIINNLEADLKAYLPDIVDYNDKKIKREIRKLIRAYDPCIACATH